jgi:hypothetical protein
MEYAHLSKSELVAVLRSNYVNYLKDILHDAAINDEDQSTIGVFYSFSTMLDELAQYAESEGFDEQSSSTDHVHWFD